MSTDIHTLAGAYALDAVSDIERAAFDRHLAECDSCAQELAELRETIARLSDVTAAVPPAGLRQAVLAEAARTRQVPPGRGSVGSAPGSRARRGWRGWAIAVAAAVVIAVGAGIGGYAISDHRVGTDRGSLAAARAEQARISTVLSASDARLKITTMSGGSQVTLVLSDKLNEGVAVLSHMPALKADQSYQLWVIHGTTPASAGVMAAGATSGTAILTDVAGAAEFGVSLEPAGGSAVPQVPLVASFPI